jgi:hypothetical protein
MNNVEGREFKVLIQYPLEGNVENHEKTSVDGNLHPPTSEPDSLTTNTHHTRRVLIFRFFNNTVTKNFHNVA